MKRTRLHCYPAPARRSFTLVEVVVGFVLLATVLVSLLLALARQRRNGEMARGRQAACLIADELLADWIESPTGIPLRGSGGVIGRPGWFWRTTVQANRQVIGIPATIVRLDVFENQISGVLISVEAAVAATGQGG